ncbi:hypothetical protein PIB30_094518 [Stylosanthes scabra]|uniref:Uncharacterized protein n=1 Tax=Stylosanthes scabra TaxID=79078 RepID=A0ABU6YT60_9FABA|nr:hypothetical protein [Stylosanthes scabra]
MPSGAIFSLAFDCIAGSGWDLCDDSGTVGSDGSCSEPTSYWVGGGGVVKSSGGGGGTHLGIVGGIGGGGGSGGPWYSGFRTTKYGDGDEVTCLLPGVADVEGEAVEEGVEVPRPLPKVNMK